MLKLRNIIRKLFYYGMVDTLAAATRNEGIAKVSSATEADGSVVTAAIGTRFTVGVNSARIRVTQITWYKIKNYQN